MGHDDDVFYSRLHGDDYDDGYDEYGRPVGPSPLGKLTVLVMMDDQVVDVMRRGVRKRLRVRGARAGPKPEPVEVAPPSAGAASPRA